MSPHPSTRSANSPMCPMRYDCITQGRVLLWLSVPMQEWDNLPEAADIGKKVKRKKLDKYEAY